MNARELEIEMEMFCRGLDRDEAELVVDARLAKLAAEAGGGVAQSAAGATGSAQSAGLETRRTEEADTTPPAYPAPAASFACSGVCECGGLCDNCEEAT